MSLENPAELIPAALDDETVTAHRPMVRGQLVGYLKGLWQYSSEELEAGKDHVRWAELQLRIIDRLMRLYKLDVPQPEVPAEEDAGSEQSRLRMLVGMQLDELAEKSTGQD
jgi:hypothetical protein